MVATELPPEEARRLIFEQLDVEHARWRDFVLRLSLEEAIAAPDGAWSPLQAWAHVVSWKDAAARIAHGQGDRGTGFVDPDATPPEILGVDPAEFNARFISDLGEPERDETRLWAEEVHHYLLRQLTQLPAPRLLGGPGMYGALNWYWHSGYTHSRLHRERMVSALTSGGPG